VHDHAVQSGLAALGDPGPVAGAFISLLVAGDLMFVRDGELRLWFRRFGFWMDLALSSGIVLALSISSRVVRL
jgi:hypothetical protein